MRIDHEKLNYSGRDFRLTDVGGRVIHLDWVVSNGTAGTVIAVVLNRGGGAV